MPAGQRRWPALASTSGHRSCLQELLQALSLLFALAGGDMSLLPSVGLREEPESPKPVFPIFQLCCKWNKTSFLYLAHETFACIHQ